MSLVAYQSGDESEKSGEESDQDSNASEISDNESSENSDQEADDASSEQRAAIKRGRDTIELNEDIEGSTQDSNFDKKKSRRNEGSVDLDEQSSNPSPLSIKVESETMEADKLEALNDNSESNQSEQTLTKAKFNLENGFPEGCENIKLPSAPRAQCSQSLQNKIIQVVDRMNRFNYSINEDIHKKKSFKNPSIYEKLIDVYGIEEFGSSFPMHVDDLKADGFLYYDELDSLQRAEWAKKEKEKKERTKIEMVSAVKKGSK